MPGNAQSIVREIETDLGTAPGSRLLWVVSSRGAVRHWLRIYEFTL
jgi:hypothetical protein